MRNMTNYYHDFLSIIKLGVDQADKNYMAFSDKAGATDLEFETPKYLHNILEKDQVMLVTSRTNLAYIGLFLISYGDKELLQRMVVGNMLDTDWGLLSDIVMKLKLKADKVKVYGVDIQCLTESRTEQGCCDSRWISSEIKARQPTLHHAIWDTQLREFSETYQLASDLPILLEIPFYERRFLNPEDENLSSLENVFTRYDTQKLRSVSA
ncbi:hypothetical protein [Teredinibacter purpureus]|uniref:hypothetical protein n=1 Tax=Teredinibacter purpureus TaxID=2731756 RepID=UPI0005F8660A|nr:hypothetical protein [Teredinibacter purpureus]